MIKPTVLKVKTPNGYIEMPFFSLAELIKYVNSDLPGVDNVKGALDDLSLNKANGSDTYTKVQIDSIISGHNLDSMSHLDIRTAILEFEGRLGRLEDMIVNDVKKNPFMLTFKDLNGIDAEGVWNKAQQRIEF